MAAGGKECAEALETCHPERSEGSLQLFNIHCRKITAGILRFAQDDSRVSGWGSAGSRFAESLRLFGLRKLENTIVRGESGSAVVLRLVSGAGMG